MGLGHFLFDFIVTPPPVPEPIQAPPQPPPQIIIEVPTPNVSFQVPSYPAPGVLQLAPIPSLLTQEQPVQQPPPAQDPPALHDFDANDWLEQSEDILNALTWQSFKWSSPDQGRYKVWAFSTLGSLNLPTIAPTLLTPDKVKQEFEKVAAMFKRACVVLRLQTGCRCPDEDQLGMSPLFGEVLALLQAAQKMTEDCEKVITWDMFDEWHLSCLYFRDSVCVDTVWDTLEQFHGPDKYRPMRRAWNDGKAEWLGDAED